HLGSNANRFHLLPEELAFPTVNNDCDCTITQVENNTVSPCTTTIGIVDTVSSASGFQTAINTANSSGGNRTILIMNGTYQVASTAWYPYITASDIVIRSLSGNRDSVILTGTGMADVSPGTEIGLYAVGDNITIADLTIKEVGNHGIAVTGEDLFVHNVRIQDTYEQMLKGNATNGGADNGKVQCSLFEYTAGIGPQWYIGGLDIHDGDDWIVRDNVFRDIESPDTTVAEHAIHFWNNSSNNTVERNVIINCDRGIGFGLGSSPNDGGLIRNNMIYNDGAGLFDDVGIGLETSPNTKVYNNTVYIEYPNAIEYRFPATINVEIVNNLTNKLIKSRDGGTAT
ncbi:MAG: right-handed parallel beta-helix repeat-containing protein, partial [Saprospiraceae bacterium]|nr:right-handed parallel beta-helix repeat-containing protein [Saprospiraceae bacterium]